MEIYKLWTEFNLRGNAFEKMEKFSTLVKLTTENSILLQKNLDSLSERMGLLNELSTKLGINLLEVGGGLSKISIEGLKGKEALSAFDRVVSNSITRTQGLARNLNSLSRSLESVAIKGGAARGTLKGGVGIGGIAGGIAGYVAADATFHLFSGGFHDQELFQKQVQQLKNSGLNDSQIREAVNFAQTPQKGISTIGRISALNDAFMATKDWKSAKMLAPSLAEAEFTANATFKNMSDQQRQFLVRFAEMRAGGDTSKIASAMDLGFRMMNASAGTIDPRQQAQFMRQSASVSYHLTDRGYAALEPVIQEISGTRVGTAFQTGYQMLGTGTGTLNNKKRVQDLVSLGIYKAAKMDREGRVLSTEVDPKLLSLYATDPVSFTKSIIDIYKAHGTTTSEDINKRLALDFPRTTAQLMSTIMKNMSKIDRQLDLFDKQQGIRKSFLQSLNIPSGASERFGNAFSSFVTVFGQFSSPAVIKGMNALSFFFEKAASFLGGTNPRADVLLKQKNKSSFILESITGTAGENKNPISSATKPNENLVVHTQVNMDGKAVAKAITMHQTNMLGAGGVTGGSSYTNIGLTPISTNYNQVGGP